jgi:hypothetical protein
MKLSAFLILLLFCSCQNSNDSTIEESASNNIVDIITKEDIQSLNYVEFVADAKVQNAISGWEKYNELEKTILDINDTNLTFFRDNHEIVEALIVDLKATVPEKVNSPHVMARIMALETKLFKLESMVNLSNVKKEPVIDAVTEVLVAFSNLNLQMNKKLEKESQNIQKPY